MKCTKCNVVWHCRRQWFIRCPICGRFYLKISGKRLPYIPHVKFIVESGCIPKINNDGRTIWPRISMEQLLGGIDNEMHKM